jgi:hypothetical protein
MSRPIKSPRAKPIPMLPNAAPSAIPSASPNMMLTAAFRPLLGLGGPWPGSSIMVSLSPSRFFAGSKRDRARQSVRKADGGQIRTLSVAVSAGYTPPLCGPARISTGRYTQAPNRSASGHRQGTASRFCTCESVQACLSIHACFRDNPSFRRGCPCPEGPCRAWCCS